MNQDSAVFLRAIRGPVMMITVGVLFALNNLTGLSFGRTWPVLLVVTGLLSLGRSSCRADRMRARYQYRATWGPSAQPSPPPPPPPAQPSPAGPGSYRGSSYESAPGSETRGTEPKRPDRGSDPGATQ